MSIVRARPPRNLCRGVVEGAVGWQTRARIMHRALITWKNRADRERDRENRIGRGRNNNNNNNEKLEGICVHTYVFIYTHGTDYGSSPCTYVECDRFIVIRIILFIIFRPFIFQPARVTRPRTRRHTHKRWRNDRRSAVAVEIRDDF